MRARILSAREMPARLLDLAQPPARLYLVGELPRGPTVGIVGTRHPTEGARAFARDLARQLAAAGIVVLSGGALGVDTAVHEGALDVGGSTVVVAPSAYDRPYPEQNAELFASIVRAGGGHLSRERPGTLAAHPKFFQRNSVLAALAHVLVLVEAPYRSGARNAVKRARELGRPVFVVPSVPWNQRGIGGLLELQRGARLLLGPGDVLAELRRQQLHPVALPEAAASASGPQLPLQLGALRNDDDELNATARDARADPG